MVYLNAVPPCTSGKFSDDVRIIISGVDGPWNGSCDPKKFVATIILITPTLDMNGYQYSEFTSQGASILECDGVSLCDWLPTLRRTVLLSSSRLSPGARECLLLTVNKGKAVPLLAWSGPEGSRKLRFPDFMTTAQDGGTFVSLTHRPPLPPGNTPGTHFC